MTLGSHVIEFFGSILLDPRRVANSFFFVSSHDEELMYAFSRLQMEVMKNAVGESFDIVLAEKNFLA